MSDIKDLFTDRESYKDKLRQSLDALLGETMKKPFALCFYGVGGQGKTAICKQLLNHIIPQQYKEKILAVPTDFEVKTHRAVDGGMLAIRKMLSENSKIRCSAFDLAFMTHYGLVTKKENIRADYPWLFMGEKSMLNDAMEIIDAAASSLPGISVLFKMGKKLVQDVNNELLKLRKDILFDIDSLSAAEIEKKFPEYMAYDLKAHFEKNPGDKRLVFTFDHFEKLWDDSASKKGLGSQYVDAWIRKMIDIFPRETLFVIFKRDRLQWTDLDVKYDDPTLLQQYLVNNFSNDDADEYLRKIPIKEAAIREKIIRSSAGLPFYLELQAKTYKNIQKSGQKPTPDAFGNDEHEILERFFAHISDQLKDTLSILAIARTVNYEIFHYLRKKKFITAGTNFESVIEHSFFEEQQKGHYSMHAIMREWLSDTMAKDDKGLFDDINESLFGYFDAAIDQRISLAQIDSGFDVLVYDAYRHNLGTAGACLEWCQKRCEAVKDAHRDILWKNIFQNLLNSYGEKDIEQKPDEIVRLTSYLYKFYDNLGMHRQAEPVARMSLKALEMLKERGVEELPIDEDDVYKNFVEALTHNNEYDEAMKFLHTTYNNSWLKVTIWEKLDQHARAEAMIWFNYFDYLQMENPYPPGALFNKIGHVLILQKRYNEALVYHQKSIEAVRSDWDKAICHYQLGKTHRLLGNKEPCLKNLSIALEVWDKLVPKDHPYPGLARRQMSACYIESGDLAEREHVAEMLANECRTLIRSNHYDPDILSFANIVNQYHTYIGVEDKLGILSQFLVKVFRFKYGDFFAPMIPHLQYLSRISGFSTTGLNQWVRDIGNVNDYNIRVEDFPHTTLTGAGAEPIVTLLRKWMSLPEDEASFSLNRYDLPFFKTFYLLEIRLSQDVPYSLYLLSNGEEIYILNSTNEPIYFVAGRDLIFEPALVSRYIVFFLDAVFGRYGRYIIIQEDKDLEWSCSNKMTEAMREAAKARIFPLELREQNENGMDFYCACIWFLDGFFTSGIHVAPNGVIEFKDTDCWDENSGVIYDMFLPQKRNSFKFIDHLRDLENFLRALMPDDVKAPAQLSSFSLLISHLHTVKSSPIYLATLPKTMLTEEEKIGLFHQLFSPEQAVDAVDQHDVEEHVLPFSKEFKLYVLNHRSLRQSSLCFFNGKESLVLDWTNEAFYDLAEKDFIFEPEAIHRYVLLFYDLVRGKFGRFTILEDPREYYFLTENYSEEDLQKVKDSIKPMVLKSQTDEEMVFSTQSVLFRNSLFSADIHVTNKGIVSIENEVDIYHNIRIIPVIYRGLQDLSKKTLFEVRRSIAELPGMLPQEQELNNLIIKEYLAQFLWEIQNETEHYIYF